jgi:hypothetical protein
MRNYRYPTSYLRGMNYYVPAMTGDTQFDDAGYGFVDFGTPNLAVADAIVALGAASTTYGIGGTAFNGSVNSVAAGFTRTDGQLTDVPWGRGLTLVASGANTNAVVINGYDYLGQPIQKSYALNGTTPVPVPVAFKWINTVVIPAGTTVSVGFSDVLGLPFKTDSVVSEFVDGGLGTLGTLVGPVLTDPATNATGDPRGTYDQQTALNGVKQIRVLAHANSWVNASGNGGLHGIRHFGG